MMDVWEPDDTEVRWFKWYLKWRLIPICAVAAVAMLALTHAIYGG